MSQTRNFGISILNDVLGSIKLNEDEISENNAILQRHLKELVEKMKEVDKLFEFLYKELYYTGSYYSDLRICNPNEYDINLVLDLPFKKPEFDIHSSYEPGYAIYKLNYPYDSRYRLLTDTLFQSGFLMSEKVRTWFQSIIDRITRPYPVYTKEAGPARTIAIRKRNDVYIEIDFVPVIECILSPSRNNLNGTTADTFGSNLKAFLVPKSPATISIFSNPRSLWRFHFPEGEEDILYNMNCAKSIIKLLKLLRDKEQWTDLASYYLKTVVMWMILGNSEKYYWNDDKKFDRFLEALEELAKYVGLKNLPYIFNEKCNLIEKMSFQESYKIFNRLNYFIRILKDDPTRLNDIF